jgi:hypothetical protein
MEFNLQLTPHNAAKCSLISGRQTNLQLTPYSAAKCSLISRRPTNLQLTTLSSPPPLSSPLYCRFFSVPAFSVPMFLQFRFFQCQFFQRRFWCRFHHSRERPRRPSTLQLTAYDTVKCSMNPQWGGLAQGR